MGGWVRGRVGGCAGSMASKQSARLSKLENQHSYKLATQLIRSTAKSSQPVLLQAAGHTIMTCTSQSRTQRMQRNQATKNIPLLQEYRAMCSPSAQHRSSTHASNHIIARAHTRLSPGTGGRYFPSAQASGGTAAGWSAAGHGCTGSAQEGRQKPSRGQSSASMTPGLLVSLPPVPACLHLYNQVWPWLSLQQFGADQRLPTIHDTSSCDTLHAATLHSSAQHIIVSLPQRSTAQHDIAQRSMAQHSTA